MHTRTQACVSLLSSPPSCFQQLALYDAFLHVSKFLLKPKILSACNKCFHCFPPPPLARRAACGHYRKKYFIGLPQGLPGPRPPARQGVSYSSQIIWVIRVWFGAHLPRMEGTTHCFCPVANCLPLAEHS